MYCRWRSCYQEGRVGIPLTGLIPPNVCSCSKLGPGFPTSYVVVFLCSATSVKIRGDCSFCWYWWNWWSSLFKLSFHNDVIIYLSGSVGSFLTNLYKYLCICWLYLYCHWDPIFKKGVGSYIYVLSQAKYDNVTLSPPLLPARVTNRSHSAYGSSARSDSHRAVFCPNSVVSGWKN